MPKYGCTWCKRRDHLRNVWGKSKNYVACEFCLRKRSYTGKVGLPLVEGVD